MSQIDDNSEAHRAQAPSANTRDASKRGAGASEPDTDRSDHSSRRWPANHEMSTRGAREPRAKQRPPARSTLRLHRSDAVVLHDRRVPGRSRANIDHIAIGPAGVTVIDTKSSRGRVQLATVGIINRREQLLVNGRDRTSQLDALERQMARVADALDRHDAGDVAVLGALCFPFMRREWLHYSRARDGLITVDDPAHIAKLVKRAGPLHADEIAWLAETLAAAFPPA